MFTNLCRKYIDCIIRKIQLKKSLDAIKTKKESFVIMFHDVSFSNDNKDKYGMNIDDFIKTIEYIQRIGYQFEDFENFMTKEERKTGYCILTFDDGFYSTYRVMKEYLSLKKIPFHVFITSDWIGREGYITATQLIEMADEDICKIGSHSCSHPCFRNLKKAEVNGELYNSKIAIEKIIKTEISAFAFPFGSKFACPNKCFTDAAKVGYKNIYSTKPLTLRKMKTTCMIPRINGVEIAKITNF